MIRDLYLNIVFISFFCFYIFLYILYIYIYRRRPSWTDRILYKVNADVYDDVTLSALQLNYKSHSNYIQSDHKPVTGEFDVIVAKSFLSFFLLPAHIYIYTSYCKYTFLYIYLDQAKRGGSWRRVSASFRMVYRRGKLGIL